MTQSNGSAWLRPLRPFTRKIRSVYEKQRKAASNGGGSEDYMAELRVTYHGTWGWLMSQFLHRNIKSQNIDLHR